jgi:hypothetical protein
MSDPASMPPNESAQGSDDVAEQMEKNLAAIKLLLAWFDEDEQEQREILVQLCSARIL